MAFLLVDVFRVFGSDFFLAGVFSSCFCFFLGLIGDGFRVFCPAYPPRSVSGLVWVISRATHLWHRTRFQSCRLSFRFPVVLDIFRVIFLFVFPLPRPPPSRVTRRWFSLTISSCSLRLGLPFIFLKRTLPASLPCVKVLPTEL